MASRWRMVTVSVVLVTGSAMCTRSAEAQIAPLSVTVVVHDYAALTPSVLEQAKGVTTMIYRQIGIQLQWWDANRSATELSNGQVPSGSVIHVRFLGSPLSKHAAGELGTAVSGGQLASVLLSPVEYVASHNGVDFDKLLGHVMAHEMGHLLLPPNSHSSTGIMAATMDLFRVEHGGLIFDQRQASMIRASVVRGVESRAGRSVVRPVYLSIVNQAGVPESVLEGARTEVARIYEAIGIHVIWVLEAPPGGDRCLYVRIVPEKTAGALKAASGVLGTAFSDGPLAHVLYDRVERFARTKCNGLAATLGLTIAHEVGHLLLQNSAHSASGLMRAQWNIADCRLAASGRLLFTPEQADSIRALLESKQGS